MPVQQVRPASLVPRLVGRRRGRCGSAAREAVGVSAPAASATAMVAARANRFAISAFDCLRIAAKGATRATVNLCPVYTAVEPKYHRRRSGALLLSGIGVVFPGQRPDEGRPALLEGVY